MAAERAAFGPLVSGRWLAEHHGDVHIVDVRWYLDGRSGLAEFRNGHIPAAVWIDLDRELSAPAIPSAGRHPLPSPEQFAAALGRAGIGTGEPVVAYDDAGGSVAARLWWMLHVLGEPVAVLDGGIASWPGTLSIDTASSPAVVRDPQPWPADRFVGADEVAAALADEVAVGHGVVLDARAAARYAGEEAGPDPRPGHIPGALSVPWAGNIDDGTGRFLDPAALRARFAAAVHRGEGGEKVRSRIVAYCGSGVTACHDLLALELAGIGDTALYTGSWSQWAADATRPVRVGADP